MRLLRGVAQHEVPCPVSMFQRGMNIGYALKTLIKVKRIPSSIVGMVIMLFFMLLIFKVYQEIIGTKEEVPEVNVNQYERSENLNLVDQLP